MKRDRSPKGDLVVLPMSLAVHASAVVEPIWVTATAFCLTETIDQQELGFSREHLVKKERRRAERIHLSES